VRDTPKDVLRGPRGLLVLVDALGRMYMPRRQYTGPYRFQHSVYVCELGTKLVISCSGDQLQW
jgi:hypothetical protein